MGLETNQISGSIVEQCDCDHLAFLDTSQYINQGADTTNPILRIYPPNWDTYVDIPYNLNAITLIRPEHINHSSFPCGVYHIVQSVCPNESTEVGFCYLNICGDMQNYASVVCKHLNNNESLEELFDIKMGLEAAQELINSDACEDNSNAITLYNESVSQLSKLAAKSDCDVC